MCLVILLLSYFSKLECSARAQPVFVRPTVRFQMQMGRTPNTLLPPLHGVTERSGAARRSSALGLNPRSNADDNQRRRRVCAPAGDQARRARRDDAGGVHSLQGVSRARWGSGVRPPRAVLHRRQHPRQRPPDARERPSGAYPVPDPRRLSGRRASPHPHAARSKSNNADRDRVDRRLTPLFKPTPYRCASVARDYARKTRLSRTRARTTRTPYSRTWSAPSSSALPAASTCTLATSTARCWASAPSPRGWNPPARTTTFRTRSVAE